MSDVEKIFFTCNIFFHRPISQKKYIEKNLLIAASAVRRKKVITAHPTAPQIRCGSPSIFDAASAVRRKQEI